MFDFVRQTVFQRHHRLTSDASPAAVVCDAATHRSREAAVVVSGQCVKSATSQTTCDPSSTIDKAATERNSCVSGPQQLRRRRVLFSRDQTLALEECFARQRYVSAADRDRLAASLALRPAQVKIWFQNRRYKLKKIRREMERNRDRIMTMMMSSTESSSSSAAAAAGTSWSADQSSFQRAVDATADPGTFVQTSSSPVVRRIAVPILVRDGRPCCSRRTSRIHCQSSAKNKF